MRTVTEDQRDAARWRAAQPLLSRISDVAHKEGGFGSAGQGQAEPGLTINAEVRRRMRQIKALLNAIDNLKGEPCADS